MPVAGEAAEQGGVHQRPYRVDSGGVADPGTQPGAAAQAVHDPGSHHLPLGHQLRGYAAISGSALAASRATSVSPAARRADSASCPAQTAANPAAAAADSACLAHSRSSIGTGASSPAIATSITALSSLALVPKTSSTVGSATLGVGGHRAHRGRGVPAGEELAGCGRGDAGPGAAGLLLTARRPVPAGPRSGPGRAWERPFIRLWYYHS